MYTARSHKQISHGLNTMVPRTVFKCRRQLRGERYDGTSTRTGPLQSKKLKIELKDNAKNE